MTAQHSKYWLTDEKLPKIGDPIPNWLAFNASTSPANSLLRRQPCSCSAMGSGRPLSSCALATLVDVVFSGVRGLTP